MPSLTNARTLNRRGAFRLGGAGLAVALTTHGLHAAEAQARSTLEANKGLVHRIFAEAINGGNVAVVAELYGPALGDSVRATRYQPGSVRATRYLPGPAGLPLPVDEFTTEYPDVSATVEDIIAEGDLVATRVTWRGTHPPAGTHVVGRTMHLFRLANEQIVEEWSSGWEWLASADEAPEPDPANPLIST
jgi:predicted SnoaL-like aldol condensation-catalyzing enzyme